MLIIFFLAIYILLEPQSLQAQSIEDLGYIQNIKTETVSLVSNNIMSGEISSYQEENNQNFSGNSPLIISYYSQNNNFEKNNPLLKGRFIHNLSTDNKKVQQIRAP